MVWCNPPYSQVARWVEKAHKAAEHGATVVLLVAARTSTVWWHEHVAPYAEIRFIKGRLRFSDATSPAPFGSALLVFRPN
jgi:phage N-6-adenine-methyltransferase